MQGRTFRLRSQQQEHHRQALTFIQLLFPVPTIILNSQFRKFEISLTRVFLECYGLCYFGIEVTNHPPVHGSETTMGTRLTSSPARHLYTRHLYTYTGAHVYVSRSVCIALTFNVNHPGSRIHQVPTFQETINSKPIKVTHPHVHLPLLLLLLPVPLKKLP